MSSLSPDEQARFFYLAIFLVVIGGYLLYDNRHRMGHTLQQAAIWGVIFMTLIIGYGFKDVLSAQLFPGRAVITESGEIVLRRARDGHFYATLQVEGVDMDFVVDTGATSVVLRREDAQALGIDPDGLSYLGRANTANGQVRIAQIDLREVRFGDFIDYDIEASVNDGELFEPLLGMDYLRRFRIEIDGNEMRLSR